jgi:hypothetical protein
MKRTIIAALALAISGPALAWTVDETTKARMIASAALAPQVCPSYRMDLNKAGVMIQLALPEGNVRDPDFQNLTKEKLSEVRDTLPLMPDFCQQLFYVFGPSAPLSSVIGPAMTVFK